MVLNGELTLFGGHTDDFLLSQSAWYLKGGAWHEVPMIYAHDHAFCTLRPDGRVMLGGGSAEAFGIGPGQRRRLFRAGQLRQAL